LEENYLAPRLRILTRTIQLTSTMKLSKRGEYGLRAMIDLATQLNGAGAKDPKTHEEGASFPGVASSGGVYTGGNNSTGVVQIRDIAERQHIPAKFLEQILLTLKNAGLLHSRMGIGGGYYLARPAEEISLGQVVRVLDGPLAPIRCVSQMSYEPCGCPDEETCGLRLVMLDVRNAIADILDRTTLADVTRRVKMARASLAGDPRLA
jgi:Rrf2 family protein